VLRAVDGRVRIVDEDLRTVFGSEGSAFQELEVPHVLRLRAHQGNVGMAKTPEGVALIAVAGLNKPNTVAPLKWSLVVEQDLAGLRLPEAMGGVGLCWSLALTGMVLLTPAVAILRLLAATASARRRASISSSVGPISPQRHLTSGMAMCLEICRQVRHRLQPVGPVTGCAAPEGTSPRAPRGPVAS
jgi:hypothetical protein